MRLLQMMLILCVSTIQVWAHATYVGYSGAPGSLGTCAGSCHGQTGGTLTVSGFPTSYVPLQAYEITVGHTGGVGILNFNASCRVGNGSVNAGTLTGGTNTATYDVTGETNGVHLSVTDVESATFNWTAPDAGTGSVRLFFAGHQGPFMGPNTEIVLTSTEGAAAPGEASNLHPQNQAVGVCPSDTLTWTAGSGASSHDIHLGTTNPPDSVANVTESWFALPGIDSGILYYWQIVERNSNGTTPGQVWQFTTEHYPEIASNPDPPDSAQNVSVQVTLTWLAGARASTHDVYFGTENGPPLVAAGLTGTTYTPLENLLPDTTYYWEIEERNCGGMSMSPTWRFRTAAVSTAGDHRGYIPTQLTLGPVYPNPFNATVTIPFALPQASKVTMTLYDVTGRQVAIMASGSFGAGVHSVPWSSEGVSSGVYLVKLAAGSRALIMKVVALK